MRTRVVIDGLSLVGQVSGVGRYCHEICRRLPRSEFDPSYYYGYVSRRLHTPSADSPLSRIKRTAVHLRLVKSLARRCLALTTQLGRWDLHWQPNFIPVPTLRARRVIATVHDFAWERYAQFHPEERVAYFRNNFYRGIETCDRIITVSEFIRAELLERLPHLADRVAVIHNGYDGAVYHPAAPGTAPGKYLLSVGSIEPRKNLLNLLKAYALLELEVRREHPLLLVGAAGWKNDEIFTLVDQLEGTVRYVGYVSDEELAAYYRGALCFVYPSFYEGFGLPPLEAMACGTPVIVSNAASLPEVCGEAARYVRPDSVDEIREALQAFIQDDRLREAHARRGLARAAGFSWDSSAAAHAALFRDVAGR